MTAGGFYALGSHEVIGSVMIDGERREVAVMSGSTYSFVYVTLRDGRAAALRADGHVGCLDSTWSGLQLSGTHRLHDRGIISSLLVVADVVKTVKQRVME